MTNDQCSRELSNWQLDIAVPEDAFVSKSTGSAKPMPFAHPNAKRPPEAKPPAKSKSSKTEGKSE